jgi:hypothetical protein
MESVLNIEVSLYRDYWDTKGKTVNLLTWLKSEEHQLKVEELRACKTKKKRDSLKAELPAITPSGVFTSRANENLVCHTGFIQIDLDHSGGNLEVPNWDTLKKELRKIENIAYLAKSVSGHGYWGLIPIPPDPEKHKAYFEAIEEIFLKQFGLVIDPAPKALASLRGYSYDPDAYFNHNAKQFTELKPSIKRKHREPARKGEILDWLSPWILKKLEEAPDGKRHHTRFKMSRLAGGYFAGGLVDETILEQMIESYQFQYDTEDPEDIQKREIKAIRDGFKEGRKEPLTEIKSFNTKDFEDKSNI